MLFILTNVKVVLRGNSHYQRGLSTLFYWFQVSYYHTWAIYTWSYGLVFHPGGVKKSHPFSTIQQLGTGFIVFKYIQLISIAVVNISQVFLTAAMCFTNDWLWVWFEFRPHALSLFRHCSTQNIDFLFLSTVRCRFFNCQARNIC